MWDSLPRFNLREPHRNQTRMFRANTSGFKQVDDANEKQASHLHDFIIVLYGRGRG
jgi:hypothetical protein